MFNEDNIKDLDNKEFRIDNFKKYSLLTAPNWKRISHKVEIPNDYKEFNSVSLLNSEQDGILIKNNTINNNWINIDFNINFNTTNKELKWDW